MSFSRLLAFMLILYADSVLAGGIHRLAFDDSGKRVNSNATVYLEGKVKSVCSDSPSMICAHWNLILDDVLHETLYASRLKDALQVWSGSASIPLRMDYAGVSLSNPVSSSKDEFGNDAMTGNFIVSFSPPAEIIFDADEVSTTKIYAKPDLANKTAEIIWAGIYFNPKYLPDKDYDLRTALLHEIGRAIGLAPSAVTASAMYPVKIAKSTKVALNSDDLFWTSSLYSTNSVEMGSLSGTFLNGKDGKPWVGAHIQLLPKANAKSFADTLDRSLFISGAFSYEEGRFKFRNVPAGAYIIFAETPPNPATLDDWLKIFSTKDSFESEFYDGAEKESNQEPVFAFTPLSIDYAALVNVVAGKEATGVTIISNVADPKIERITAKGSPNEILSSSIAPAQKTSADLPEPQPSSESKSGGGCSLQPLQSFSAVNLLALIFVLFLLLLIRRDLRAKSYLAECQKRGRYVR
jgi:hypothetical protein